MSQSRPTIEAYEDVDCKDSSLRTLEVDYYNASGMSLQTINPGPHSPDAVNYGPPGSIASMLIARVCKRGQ